MFFWKNGKNGKSQNVTFWKNGQIETWILFWDKWKKWETGVNHGAPWLTMDIHG